MPTLSQIKVGQTTYDICDVEARNSITTLENYTPNSWFITVSASNTSANIAASNSGSVTVTPSPPSGYTPLGVVGYQSNTTDAVPYRITRSGNSITFGLKNVSTGTRNPTMTAYMLCVKNTALSTE